MPMDVGLVDGYVIERRALKKSFKVEGKGTRFDCVEARKWT